MIASCQSVPYPCGLSAGHFRQIAEQGFGDRENSYAYSCVWFNDHVYIGTNRYALAALLMQAPFEIRLNPTPVPRIDYSEMDLRGQIWRYSPSSGVWDCAFRSPLVEGVGGAMVPLALSFRNMTLFQGRSDPRPAVYTVPNQGRRVLDRCMLRTFDGVHFESVPPPTMPGEAGKWRSFRGFVPFKGRLFASPASSQRNVGRSDRPQEIKTLANIAAGARVCCSDDPASGRWEPSSPPNMGDPTNRSLFEMAVCGDYLYVGTLNVREGFQLWRTDGEGPSPHRWEKVLDRGADRGPLNQAIQCMTAFQGDLYLGTCIQNGGYDKINNIGPAGGEIIRLHPDGSWDLVMGEPRHTRSGLKIPTSGIGPGFGIVLNGYIWRMAVHAGTLYVGTGKLASMIPYSDRTAWPEYIRRVFDSSAIDRLLEVRGGAELWRTSDGDSWLPVTINGFNNPCNTGIRSLLPTPKGLFVGTANLFGARIAVHRPGGWRYEDNPRGGLEVWHGSHEHSALPSREPTPSEQPRETRLAAVTTRAEREERESPAPPYPPDQIDGLNKWLHRVADVADVDPLVSMALEDPTLAPPKPSVEEETAQIFGGSELRNVGYWKQEAQTPRSAAAALVRELLELLPVSSSTQPLRSFLILGRGGGEIAAEILHRFGEATVTALAGGRPSATRARKVERRAKITEVGGRELARSSGKYDVVLSVEGVEGQGRAFEPRSLFRLLRPGGHLLASEIVPALPRTSDPELPQLRPRELEAAGFQNVQVLDVTRDTWKPFYEYRRSYFLIKKRTLQIDLDRYHAILRALPGGGQTVGAYVFLTATKAGTS